MPSGGAVCQVVRLVRGRADIRHVARLKEHAGGHIGIGRQMPADAARDGRDVLLGGIEDGEVVPRVNRATAVHGAGRRPVLDGPQGEGLGGHAPHATQDCAYDIRQFRFHSRFPPLLLPFGFFTFVQRVWKCIKITPRCQIFIARIWQPPAKVL